MGVEELAFNATTVYQAIGTDGIQDHLEIPGSPFIEVFRVTSNESGDWLFCRKINKVMGVWVQNHGTTFATGVAVDAPKLTVDDTTTTGGAKITITHTTARETFTIVIMGWL